MPAYLDKREYEIGLALSGTKGMGNWIKVKEGHSGDEVVQAIESGGDQVLGVVTEELHGGEHGKTSVLEFGELTLLERCWVKVGLARGKVSEVTKVVDGSDEEDHLEPSEGWDGINGGNAVGDIREGNSRGNFTRPPENLGGDVSEDAKLGHTAVLEFRGTVLVKGRLVNVLRQSKRIKEASGVDHTELVLIGHLCDRRRASRGSRRERSGRADEEGGDGELHVDRLL
eukprot:scaffold9446_cov42-Attheya_sp.AAC.2